MSSLSTLQFVTLLFLAILVFWAVGAVNRLQRLRQAILETQPPLAALLVLRHEWVSRMASTLRAHLPEESASFDRALAASTQADAALALVQTKPFATGPISSLSLAESVLDDAVHPLLLRHEAHEAAQTWVQDWLAAQSQLAAARQRFNDATRAYNGSVRQFPTNVIAALWGFRAAAPIEAPRHTAEPVSAGAQP